MALPAYLILTMGARMAGVRAWARALLRPRPGDPFPQLLAVFILIGIPLSLLLSFTPTGYPRDGHPSASNFNNAFMFLAQSKYLAWLFAVGAVWGWAGGRGKREVWGACLLIALSVPSAIQNIVAMAAVPLGHPRCLRGQHAGLCRCGGAAGGVLAGFGARFAVGDHDHRVSGAGPERLPLFVPLSFAAGGLARRAGRFWAEWNDRRPRNEALGSPPPLELLSTLRADYVIVDGHPGGPAIGTAPTPPPGLTLERCFLNSEFAVYRVLRTGTGR